MGMTDRLLSLTDRSRPAPPPGHRELRDLERRLRRRIAGFDARVDALLVRDAPPSARDVADIDVLCAAIDEARGLLDEAVEAAGGAGKDA